MFFLAEYVNMVTVSAVATSLYFGGWCGLYLCRGLQRICCLIKLFLLFFYVWVRWTLPRYRYDQLMQFGWKCLLPLAVLNLLGTAALISWIETEYLTPPPLSHLGLILDTFAFYIFAAIAVAASLGVIGQGNPMHSIILLITSFGALAGLYVLLDAPFTAVTQIIIYAGAIMVLFLFVVMLLNVPREEPAPVDGVGPARPSGFKIGAGLSVLLAIEVVWGLSRLGIAGFAQDAEAMSVTRSRASAASSSRSMPSRSKRRRS